jgi:hypothetical protein
MEYTEQARYDNIKKIFTENFDEIQMLIENSVFKNTAKALFRFALKMEMINDNLIKTNDLYSARILLRCMLEHEIVAYYLWAKYIQNNNDDCGSQYYTEYFVSEQLKRENYNLTIEGIEKGIEKNQTIENLKQKLPFLQEASIQDFEKVHQGANQFDIRRIAKYLNSEIPENVPTALINRKVILDALIKYNFLSSYVHGGASSEYETFDHKKEDKAEALRMTKSFGLIGTRFIMEQVIMFLADENPKYVELIRKITSFNQLSI